MLCLFMFGSKALAGADKREGISYMRSGSGYEGYGDANSRKSGQA